MNEWVKIATAVFAGSLLETAAMFTIVTLRGRRAAKAAEAKVAEFQESMGDWLQEYGEAKDEGVTTNG